MDKDILKTLVPINSLTPDNYQELSAQAVIERLPAESRGALKNQVQHLWEIMLHGKNLPAVEY